MALLLANSGLMNVDFGSPSWIFGIPQKTFVLTFNKTADANNGFILNLGGTIATDNTWAMYTRVTGRIRFQYGWTTATSGVGLWDSPVISNNANHQLVITYDDSSASNDPIMYVDGVSGTVNDVNVPSGSVPSGTTGPLKVGSSSSTNSIDATLYSVLIYNRIWSAQESADSAASRLWIPTYKGLIFAPNLLGAKGLQTFDGTTLASGNTFTDEISGAIGTPANSPVGKADTYLCFGN